jgi:hypothetical protein
MVMSRWYRAPQRQEWLHNAGDGRTAPEMVDETCSICLGPRRRRSRAPGRRPYILRGCFHSLSRGSLWEDGSRRHSVLE